MDLDTRKISVEYQADVADNSEPDDNYYSMSQRIVATYNGKEIGYINFEHVEQEPSEDENFQHENEGTSLEEIIYLSKIEVPSEYRGFGISGILYKKFGEVYSQKFMGLPVERHFENPIAEYSFKKAIDEGWVPTEAYSPNRTTRDYNTTEKQQLWQDLRQKLPENLQADVNSIKFTKEGRLDLRSHSSYNIKKDMRKQSSKQQYLDLRKNKMNKFASESIDIRNGIDVEFDGSIGSSEYANGVQANVYMITALLNGGEIGSVRFTEYKCDSNGDFARRDKLHIDLIKVENQYQNLGIGQLLLKKFGEVYQNQFDRLPVSADFHNPIAEYSYRKAISLGWISGWALDDDKLKRNYDKQDKTMWKDLRKKIPPMYRG
ncbi:hypothetical protein D3C87_75930 [compost metagenome]